MPLNFGNMTKIGEEYTLGSINVKTYFHLPFSRVRDNCFLVNDGRNSVVKVQDRKLLHSWTLTHPNCFTCPVALDENEAIYGVMNCNTLLKWSLEDDNLKNAAKFKFPESVFAVLPICGKQPIVLFSSGKVLLAETLPSSKELIGQSFLRKTEEMVWADATTYQSKIIIVCLSVSKKDKSYKLYSFTIRGNNVTDYFNQPLVHESDILRSWCFNKSTVSFFTIWSSGLILSHQIATSGQSAVLTVPDIQDSHLLAIDSIDSNHIALVKCNPKERETILEIWNVQFTALTARKALKSASPSFIQLLATDSVIFLSYNEELIELSFQVEKSTLAAAVSRSTTSVSKMKEYAWKDKKLSQVTSIEQTASEKMDTSETELTPTELIAQRLMEEGAAYLKYIPESELVSLLRLAIRYKFKEKSKNNIEPDVILTAIFSSSFNDIYVMKFMKIMNLEETMVTLETLLSLLNNKSPFSSASNVKPSDLQLFNWICLVIQSHMESLLLSKDKKCIKLMKKLDKCLSEKMAEYEDYESIQNIFFTINKKNILPERYVDSRYCIETLDT